MSAEAVSGVALQAELAAAAGQVEPVVALLAVMQAERFKTVRASTKLKMAFHMSTVLPKRKNDDAHNFLKEPETCRPI